MLVAAEIGHPAHVHIFKHVVERLKSRGHQVDMFTRDKDVVVQLMADYGLPHRCLSRQGQSMAGLFWEMLKRDWGLWRHTRRRRPQVFLSVSSMSSAHVAWLGGVKSIVLDDTEVAKMERAVWLPFASVVCTPEPYTLDLGPKQLRYPSYQELAYLHPDLFAPDPQALEAFGVRADQAYSLLRLVSWRATHDRRQRGLSLEGARALVQKLAAHGKVLISSELGLPQDLARYRIKASPTLIHHLLAFSRLYVGEGASMASEAAMLGVPAIYANTISAGTLGEQQNRYGLLRQVTDERQVCELADAWLSDAGISHEFQGRRKRMLNDKINFADWLVRLVESFDPAKREDGSFHQTSQIIFD